MHDWWHFLLAFWVQLNRFVGYFVQLAVLAIFVLITIGLCRWFRKLHRSRFIAWKVFAGQIVMFFVYNGILVGLVYGIDVGIFENWHSLGYPSENNPAVEMIGMGVVQAIDGKEYVFDVYSGFERGKWFVAENPQTWSGNQKDCNGSKFALSIGGFKKTRGDCLFFPEASAYIVTAIDFLGRVWMRSAGSNSYMFLFLLAVTPFVAFGMTYLVNIAVMVRILRKRKKLSMEQANG